jgi:hypothetical protein
MRASEPPMKLRRSKLFVDLDPAWDIDSSPLRLIIQFDTKSAQEGPLGGRTNTGNKMKTAIENAGVEFIDENGGGGTSVTKISCPVHNPG